MPVTSKTQICNMTLGSIGVNARIGDVDTEVSPEAIACRLFYDQVGAQLLEVRPWPFATKRGALVDLGTPPADWGYRYKYPTDCALAVKIINPYMRTEGTDKKIPFKVINLSDAYGKAILCDIQDAELEYNETITDESLFSFSYVQAYVMGLAAPVGMTLRVDKSIVDNASKQFSGWLEEASLHVMRERQEDPFPISELESARG